MFPKPEYTTRIDDTDPNNQYIGIASPASNEGHLVWQIRKIITAGAITSMKYASGTNEFDKSWTARATYTFS